MQIIFPKEKGSEMIIVNDKIIYNNVTTTTTTTTTHSMHEHPFVDIDLLSSFLDSSFQEENSKSEQYEL